MENCRAPWLGILIVVAAVGDVGAAPMPSDVLAVYVMDQCCSPRNLSATISALSPLYLRSISALSPLYLRSISALSPHLQFPPSLSLSSYSGAHPHPLPSRNTTHLSNWPVFPSIAADADPSCTLKCACRNLGCGKCTRRPCACSKLRSSTCHC